MVRDAGAWLTRADRRADSGERVAHGRGRETRTRRPLRTARWVRGDAAEPSPARWQRPLRRGGHRAARREQEWAGAICLGRARPPERLQCLLAPAARPALGPHGPSWGIRTPACGADIMALPGPQPRLGPRLSAITHGSRGLGRGGGAPGRVPHTWPRRGARLQALNPGFGASGSQGWASSSSFPRSPPNHAPTLTVTRARPLASPPRVSRGVAARGLASREREGA